MMCCRDSTKAGRAQQQHRTRSRRRGSVVAPSPPATEASDSALNKTLQHELHTIQAPLVTPAAAVATLPSGPLTPSLTGHPKRSRSTADSACGCDASTHSHADKGQQKHSRQHSPAKVLQSSQHHAPPVPRAAGLGQALCNADDSSYPAAGKGIDRQQSSKRSSQERKVPMIAHNCPQTLADGPSAATSLQAGNCELPNATRPSSPAAGLPINAPADSELAHEEGCLPQFDTKDASIAAVQVLTVDVQSPMSTSKADQPGACSSVRVAANLQSSPLQQLGMATELFEEALAAAVSKPSSRRSENAGILPHTHESKSASVGKSCPDRPVAATTNAGKEDARQDRLACACTTLHGKTAILLSKEEASDGPATVATFPPMEKTANTAVTTSHELDWVVAASTPCTLARAATDFEAPRHAGSQETPRKHQGIGSENAMLPANSREQGLVKSAASKSGRGNAFLHASEVTESLPRHTAEHIIGQLRAYSLIETNEFASLAANEIHGSDAALGMKNADGFKHSDMAVSNMRSTCRVPGVSCEEYDSITRVVVNTDLLHVEREAIPSEAHADEVLLDCTHTDKPRSEQSNAFAIDPRGEAENESHEAACSRMVRVCVMPGTLKGELCGEPQGTSGYGSTVCEPREMAFETSSCAEADVVEDAAGDPKTAASKFQATAGGATQGTHPLETGLYPISMPKQQCQHYGRRRGKRVKLDPAFLCSQDNHGANCPDPGVSCNGSTGKQTCDTKLLPHICSRVVPSTELDISDPSLALSMPFNGGGQVLSPCQAQLRADIRSISDVCRAGNVAGTCNAAAARETCVDVQTGHLSTSTPPQLATNESPEATESPLAKQGLLTMHTDVCPLELPAKVALEGLHTQPSMTLALGSPGKTEILCKPRQASTAALRSSASCPHTLKLNREVATSSDDAEWEPSPGPWFVKASSLLHCERSWHSRPNSASQSAGFSLTSASPCHLESPSSEHVHSTALPLPAASDDARMPSKPALVSPCITRDSNTCGASQFRQPYCSSGGGRSHAAAPEDENMASRMNMPVENTFRMPETVCSV
jgi:hypothetical protein